jgi:hypothetical protein
LLLLLLLPDVLLGHRCRGLLELLLLLLPLLLGREETIDLVAGKSLLHQGIDETLISLTRS